MKLRFAVPLRRFETYKPPVFFVIRASDKFLLVIGCLNKS